MRSQFTYINSLLYPYSYIKIKTIRKIAMKRKERNNRICYCMCYVTFSKEIFLFLAASFFCSCCFLFWVLFLYCPCLVKHKYDRINKFMCFIHFYSIIIPKILNNMLCYLCNIQFSCDACPYFLLFYCFFFYIIFFWCYFFFQLTHMLVMYLHLILSYMILWAI